MSGVTITVDVGPTIQWLTDIQTQQVPFATSRAINDTAVEVQEAQRAGMRERFIIRKDWVLKGVRISKFSNKKDSPISATIDIAPDRDMMFKFETGGQKLPRVAGNIAVPTDAVRGGPRGIVPKNMRPRALGFQETTTKSGAVQIKGSQRTFIINSGGTPGIYQRTSSKAIRLLYKLFKAVPIPNTLEFQATAQRIVQARFTENFKKRLREALASAR